MVAPKNLAAVMVALSFLAPVSMPTSVGAQAPQTPPSQPGPGTGQTSPPKDQSPSRPTLYKPPRVGVPGGRIGGGARGDDQTFSLSVVAPSDHTGLTSLEQPALYWYLSKPFTSPIEFTLIGDDVKPLVEVSLPTPYQPGLQRIRLADFGVRLSPDSQYFWFVSFVVDPNLRSRDILAGATIRRIQLADDLSKKLDAADKADRAKLFAESGLWYDAIASISNAIEADPKNLSLRTLRASLLEQIGLEDAAKRQEGTGAAH